MKFFFSWSRLCELLVRVRATCKKKLKSNPKPQNRAMNMELLKHREGSLYLVEL